MNEETRLCDLFENPGLRGKHGKLVARFASILESDLPRASAGKYHFPTATVADFLEVYPTQARFALVRNVGPKGVEVMRGALQIAGVENWPET